MNILHTQRHGKDIQAAAQLICGRRILHFANTKILYNSPLFVVYLGGLNLLISLIYFWVNTICKCNALVLNG